MADSRAEARKVKVSLEHLVVPASMEVLTKQNKRREAGSWHIGTNLKELIATKVGAI